MLLLPAVIPVRPTGHRLVVGLGAASILLAALLQLDLALEIVATRDPAREDVPLILNITEPSLEQASESTRADQAVQESTERERLLNESEFGRTEQEERLVDSAEPPAGPEPVRDWYALIEQSAEAAVDEHFRREDLRALMWRESRSVMFRPGDDFNVIEAEPLLPDIRFREPVGVVGIGFTVGSCFIGIPILGVPVEERTVAIRLFVCRG